MKTLIVATTFAFAVLACVHSAHAATFQPHTGLENMPGVAVPETKFQAEWKARDEATAKHLIEAATIAEKKAAKAPSRFAGMTAQDIEIMDLSDRVAALEAAQ